jgi:hypothetical protein
VRLNAPRDLCHLPLPNRFRSRLYQQVGDVQRGIRIKRADHPGAVEQNAALGSLSNEVVGTRYLNHPASPHYCNGRAAKPIRKLLAIKTNPTGLDSRAEASQPHPVA